jgi:Domain of unknown function (DUF1707)
MNTQPAHDSAIRPAPGGPGTRASDADRDTTADLLNSALADGRLTAGEHDQRLSAAYAARTWQELRQLTAELPVPHGSATARGTVARLPTGTDLCLLCALLVVCPPAGVAWWLMTRRRPPALRAADTGQRGQHAEDR